MKFRLSRQPQRPGDTLTRFHVLSDDSTVGIFSVPSEAAADLERHWLQPQAAAPAKKGALAAALEANKRPGALPPDHASKKENPAVAAMLAAAKKNRLSQAAILRGC